MAVHHNRDNLCAISILCSLSGGFTVSTSRLVSGSIKLLRDEVKQWELQVDHSFFALHKLDITVSHRWSFHYAKLFTLQCALLVSFRVRERMRLWRVHGMGWHILWIRRGMLSSIMLERTSVHFVLVRSHVHVHCVCVFVMPVCSFIHQSMYSFYVYPSVNF